MQVSYLPLSLLVTAFKKENVQRPLEGFGVLVPSKEQEDGLKTIGELLCPFWSFGFLLILQVLFKLR